MAALPTDPRAQRLVLLAALPLVAAFAYYQFAWSPRSVELDALEERVVKLESDNERAETASRRGDAARLQAEAAGYEANLRVMRSLVPQGNEVPALLEQVSTAARRVGLDIASVQPEPVIAGDQFDTHRYKMSVVGNYHAVGEFLAGVGSLTRIMAPVGMRLEPTQPSEATRIRQRPNEQLVKATFSIQTYVAKAPAPAETRS